MQPQAKPLSLQSRMSQHRFIRAAAFAREIGDVHVVSDRLVELFWLIRNNSTLIMIGDSLPFTTTTRPKAGLATATQSSIIQRQDAFIPPRFAPT